MKITASPVFRAFYCSRKNDSFSKNNFLNYKPFLDKDVFFKGNTESGIYAVDSDANYKKYLSEDEITLELKIPRKKIRQCMDGEIDSCKGYTFIAGDEVEIIKDGKTEIDEEFIKSLAKLVSKGNIENKSALYAAKKPQEEEFYSIDINRNCKKFSSKKEASDACNVNSNRISCCLRGKARTAGGYAFVHADKIENQTTGELRKEVINFYASFIKEKLPEVIYALSEKECLKFETRKEASKAIGVSMTTLLNCLHRKQTLTNGYYIIAADELEIKNEDGSVSINKEKFLEVKKEIQKNALYIVKTDGSYKRFSHQGEALSQKTLWLDSDKKFHERGGCYCIPALSVEHIDEDGNFILDKNKLKEIFEKRRQQSVYVADKDGHVRKYNTNKTTFEQAHIPYEKIYKPQEGYKIIRAVDVESKNEQGGYYLDYEKLNELLKL